MWKRTWKNLAEELDFLLEVAVRELLMGGLHKIFTRIEEILEKKMRQSSHIFIKTLCTENCQWLIYDMMCKLTHLKRTERVKFTWTHKPDAFNVIISLFTAVGDKHEPVCMHLSVCRTSKASKPQYSRASSSSGTSACSKRVVPHVFKMKRLLETNMLLSLGEAEREREKITKEWLVRQLWLIVTVKWSIHNISQYFC